MEDDPAAAEHVAGAVGLACPGWRITRCDTAAKATGVLRDPAARVTLALVDIGLPDASGIEVIQAVRQRFAGCVILAVTVVSSHRTLLSAIRAGANGYLLKDDAAISLAGAIEQALAGKSPISAELASHLFRLATAVPGERAGAEALPGLSARETELLRHLAEGCTYAQAAQRMGISQSTVENYVVSLYRKLGVRSRSQAVNQAWRGGLLREPGEMS